MTGSVLTGAGADTASQDGALSVASVNGTAVSGPTTINGLYGTLVIKADGSYTYELNNSLLAVNQLNAGDKLRRHLQLRGQGHGRLDVAQHAGHHHQRPHRRAAGGDHPGGWHGQRPGAARRHDVLDAGLTISSEAGVASITLGFTSRTAAARPR